MRRLYGLGWVLILLVGRAAVAQPAKPANGLTGEYFSGPNFERKVLTRTDPTVDFDWNWQSPGPGVPREYFSVRWRGKLYAPVPGRYRFRATVDDGVRVWVNNKKVIDEWRKQDDSNFIGDILLKGGQLYDLRIEYYNDWKGSVISVFWEPPNQQRPAGYPSLPNQVIPARYLFTPSSRLPPVGAVAAKTRPVSPKRPDSKPTAPPANPTRSVTPAGQAFDNLKRGDALVLRNVIFEQGDYRLLPTSYADLDKLVVALLANPALRVEVAGHTDNVGDPRLNRALSENRAKVVAAYLTRHGIAETRITAKGYGGSRPLGNNATEGQRAINRRVELIVN